MAEPITMQKLIEASMDSDSLEILVNGDENTQVTTRLGETYPSAKKAIKTMFENGGLPATPFATHADMIASPLSSGSYAFVTNDNDVEKNGLYVNSGGSWVYTKYNDLLGPQSGASDAGNLKSLRADLANPLKDVKIKLIGDSITWGVGASNTSDVGDRTGKLNDKRNTTQLTSPSWANLFANHIVGSHSSGAISHDGNGAVSAIESKLITIDKDADLFRFSRNDEPLTNNDVRSLFRVSSGAKGGGGIDIVAQDHSSPLYPDAVEFEVNGSGFTLYYMRFEATRNTELEVRVDGVLKHTLVGNGASFIYDLAQYVDLGDSGTHRVELRNISQGDAAFRIQCIERDKTISVTNHAISGSYARRWLEYITLADSIKPKDDYVFVMLGTNDRNVGANATPTEFAKHLRQVVTDTYSLSDNNAKIVMMSANAVNQDETDESRFIMEMSEIADIISSVANEFGLPYIDNYSVTKILEVDGVTYLSDGLHPNDVGHKVLFNNILSSLGYASQLDPVARSDIFEIHSEVNELKKTKADAITDENKPTLARLYDDLHNPLMNVRVKLVGDSITWGYKASGESVADPRNGKLTDPRNTTDAAISPSWANLLSRYLMTAFSDGAITHAGNGLAYADSANTVTISKNANLFSFYSSRLDKTYTSAQAVAQVGTSTTSETGEYFDLTSTINTDDKPTELSFYTNADTFTIIYAELSLINASDYKVEILIDDVSHEVFSPYSATNAFNKRKVVIGQAGRHKITIRNITTGFYGHFRLQGLELTRRLSAKNDGIIGSTTKSWLSTVTLSDSIASNDDYVFVQLGTNDRVKSANIALSDTAKNLRTIVSDIYTMTSNNAKVIMMSANAVTQTETNTDVFRFNMRDLNNCIKNVASDLGLPFISNYEQTLQTKLDGTVFLADGLHPNDVGYRIMFNNIKDAITKR